MPELPEVEITTRKLKPLILGKRISGRKILNIERRGKAILIYLSGGKILGFHQRMSGKLLVVDRNFNDKHIRRRFRLSGGKDLVLHDVRKFGVVWYGPAKQVMSDQYFRTLGPDALTISLEGFKKVLAARLVKIHKPHPGPLLRKEREQQLNPSPLRRGKGRDRGLRSRSIKSFFLDQKNLAGIGNIMADEILWHAEIHSKREVRDLSKLEVRNLWISLKFILKRSIKLGGSTMRDWLQPGGEAGGYFEKRFVYDREGKKCFRCKAKIIRKKIAGRSSYFCPRCQRV